jgi:hypothetical protein
MKDGSGVSTPPEPRFFFVKVMKTGGGTFLRHILANFERHEVYPYREYDADMQIANMGIDYLTGLPPERRARIKVYTGHFPFVAAELVGGELITLTILRDPVERTISYLKHCKRFHEHQRNLPLEDIYEDPFNFPTLIRNHQAKLFAMTPEDEPETYLDVMEIDDRRLEIAKANLERVDVLGLQEHFPEFLDEMSRRHGWQFGEDVEDHHVSAETELPESFRRRIAEDNAADIEFYEYARSVWMRRRAGVAS